MSWGRGAGTRGGRRAVRGRSPGGHSLPSVPSAGREGRDERDALGPAAAAAAEDAGSAATWLPGRRALPPHTHTPFPMGAAVRRPGLGPGLSFTSSWIRQTHSDELCMDWPGLQVLASVVKLGLGALGLLVFRFRLKVSGMKSPDPSFLGFAECELLLYVYMAPLSPPRRSCVGRAVLCVALSHSTPIFRSLAFDLSPWCELNARSPY